MSKKIEDLHGVIVGLGSIGNRHLNNLIGLGVKNLSVVRRASSTNSHFAVPPGVTTYHCSEEAITTSPDFVIICNPSHLHAQTAIEYLKAGVHVLIEKPLGKEIGPAEQELIDLAVNSDQIVAMAYCMRFHPAYATAREKVRDGAIGRCLYAKAWFEGYLPDWHPWEDYKQSYAALKEQGGGVLRTLDHELDFLNWVLGPAESAIGEAINSDGIGIEADDVAMYLMKHPNDVRSHVTTAFCRKPPSRGFEFVGTEGVISFRHEDGALLLSGGGRSESETVLTTTSDDIAQMYVALLKDFLALAFEDSASDSSGLLKDGVNALQLINQIDAR